MGRIIEGFWDCKYCDTKHIRGGLRECPNCGRAQDCNTNFDLDKNKISYLSEEEAAKINKNPDWICPYCDQLNSDNEKFCASCGAPRTKENLNYFENQEKKRQKQESNFSSTSSYSDFISDSVSDSLDNTDDTDEYDDEIAEKKKLWKISVIVPSILIALLTILGITGLIFLLTPKEQELTVQELSWQRSIDIEKYQTVEESGWSLPYDARLLYSREEFSHYEQVLDHYETKTREVEKERISGYEEYVSGYRDLGNGYFEEITSSRPVYETYYETETYEEPVYRDEAVYQTKYYYEIDKWLYERSVKTEGSDQNPYWGEAVLLSNERISANIERYSIVGVDEKGKEQTISLSYDDWISLQIGQTAKFKITLGHGKIVE